MVETVSQEQRKTKPKLEEFISAHLNAEWRQDALIFLDYCKAKKISYPWSSTNTWTLKSKGKSIGLIWITAWLFGDGYGNISRKYGYFYAPGGSYSTKAIIFKLHLLDFQNMSFDKGDLVSLLFTVFVLSHFKTAKESVWLSLALAYLDQYKTEAGRYSFPSHMITEKPDSYVIFGGHMNVGENKKSKLYNEIISTYWMDRIHKNLIGKESEDK